MFFRITILTIFASLFSLNLPVKAETCIPIPLVGGQGNTVTKTVSQPTIPGPFDIDITRNNWNTDWAVPGSDANFRRFVVTITSNDGGPFDIQMYLKYSDQTADQFYNQEGVQLVSNKPLKIQGTPRSNNQPYQVNLYVGDIDALGKTYTASVVACR